MLSRAPSGSPCNAGFTLLELMVTVAIIALVVAVAVPAYNGHVRSSREGVLVANMLAQSSNVPFAQS